MTAALELAGIAKSYGDVPALADIDLAVDEGEFVVFVGPSGCGKSTLLRVIAGLEEATAGTVAIGGRNVDALPPAKRGIAMVFQSYALYPHLTVQGNMELALRQEKQPRATVAERVSKASAMLGLAELLGRRPAELSGGQRQRAAIGRAIVREPRLFLFDEPLSNLDASLRANTRVELARLHRALSATIAYVTHDQVEAMTLADRIVILDAGRIEQAGAPMDLYNDPANRFVAGFLGSPAINFLPGAAVGAAGDVEVGIRPEHLQVVDAGGRLDGTVAHVERLGGDTNIIVDLGDGTTVTSRMFGQHASMPGDEVSLAIADDVLLRFDHEGRRRR